MRRLMPFIVRYGRVVALILIGWFCWAIAGTVALAAEQPRATSMANQPLDFSGGGRSELLAPDVGADGANRARLEFLNQRSSVGGVLQGSGDFAAPLARPSYRDSQNPRRRQDRVDFQEMWLQGGGGPTTADFERAAGVRSSGSGPWDGDPAGSRAASAAAAAARSPRPIDSSSVDLATGRLDFSSEYRIRRSLDPVLDFGLSGRSLSPSGIGSPSEFRVHSGLAEPELRGSGQSDMLNPIARNPFNDMTAAPRTVRELIDSSQSVRARASSSPALDRDTTRDELNPYTPQWREDFQFSVGDSRLGISAQPTEPVNRGLSPLRGQNPRMGPSSLAPALVLPVPESVAVPTRRQSEAQFPVRRF